MALNPSWKDYLVTFGSGTSTHFRIRMGSTEIYEGRYYPQGGVSFGGNIRDIVADYLALAAPTFTDGAATLQPNLIGTFTVETENAGQWTPISQHNGVQFILDNSYDIARTLTSAAAAFMHAPITDRAAAWQFLFYESAAAAGLTITRTAADGTQTTGTVALGAAATFAFTPHVGMARVNIKETDTPAKTLTWEVVCGDYALYYQNALGGWDSLLLEGTCARSASVSRNSHRQAYNNGVSTAANTNNYLNEVTEKYVLRTGILTDEQSARMWHLLGSTRVFLHDNARGQILPVSITDNAYEVKTFKAQGKMFQYTMNAEVLRDYQRR